MKLLLIFVAAFAIVFALGFQSLNVNRGHYWLASLTSLFIGTANLALLKLVPQASDPAEIAAYLLGGPLGILLAMRLHPSRQRKEKS